VPRVKGWPSLPLALSRLVWRGPLEPSDYGDVSLQVSAAAFTITPAQEIGELKEINSGERVGGPRTLQRWNTPSHAQIFKPTSRKGYGNTSVQLHYKALATWPN
jgi:hypothetical protein